MSASKNEHELLRPELLLFSDGRPQVVVDAETGCWVWQGTKTRRYGRIRVGKRSSVQAHRHFYSLVYGPVPDELEVGHSCVRRTCVNPSHMVLQTKPENKKERYKMPTLSKATLREIEGHLLADKPNGWIADEYGISEFAVRRITRNFNWPSLPF